MFVEEERIASPLGSGTSSRLALTVATILLGFVLALCTVVVANFAIDSVITSAPTASPTELSDETDGRAPGGDAELLQVRRGCWLVCW